MSLFNLRGSTLDGAPRTGRRLARSVESAAPDLMPQRNGGARIGTIVGGAIAGGAMLAAGALAAQWLRERGEQEPDYDLLREDGAISLRRYRPMTVAIADANGSMRDAMDSGFRRLFAYIAGKTRPSGDDTKIAMTVPVLAIPSDHPGGWLVCLVMPKGKPIQTLPNPGAGIRIEEMPARTVAAIRFSGRITDRAMAEGEVNQLRSWLKKQNLTAKSEPAFAAYNSPAIPGPLRRNEWWIEITEPAR